MSAGKRRIDVVDLTGDDEIENASDNPKKVPRMAGTHQAPIELEDTDDEVVLLDNPAPRPRRLNREHSAEPGASRTRSPGNLFRGNAQYEQQARFEPPDALDDSDDDDDNPDPLAFLNAYTPRQVENAAGELLDSIETDQQSEQLPYQAPVRRGTPQLNQPFPDIVPYEDCLARTLQMFPDVAHDHVLELHTSMHGSVQLVLDHIIEHSDYPKQKRGPQPLNEAEPRGREINLAEQEALFTRQDRPFARGKLREALVQILKDEFPTIPVAYINIVHTPKRHLFPAYVALVKSGFETPLPYPPAQPRVVRTVDFNNIMRVFGAAAGALEDELVAGRAARHTLERENAESVALQIREAEIQKREEEQLAIAKATGTVAECTVCSDEVPHTGSLRCNGEDPHYTCFECSNNNVSAQVGDSKGRILCPSGCGGGYSEVQLRLLPDTKLVEKFLKLQQEQDVREAGIDDLCECPFCDYQDICPPLDVDSEFRCQNDDCRITSCRKCQKHTHVPDTCEENAKKTSKDAALDQRHKIEEAMTQALVRNCNKCKKPFIKDIGCNKMTCPVCKNHQCYVCSATVNDYRHFSANPGGCPLHDNVDDRHEKEIRDAEAAAKAKVTAENPLVNEEDLAFQVSERVKADEAAAEARRVAQRGRRFGGGPEDLAMARAMQAQQDLHDIGPGWHPVLVPGLDAVRRAVELAFPDRMRLQVLQRNRELQLQQHILDQVQHDEHLQQQRAAQDDIQELQDRIQRRRNLANPAMNDMMQLQRNQHLQEQQLFRDHHDQQRQRGLQAQVQEMENQHQEARNAHERARLQRNQQLQEPRVFRDHHGQEPQREMQGQVQEMENQRQEAQNAREGALLREMHDQRQAAWDARERALRPEMHDQRAQIRAQRQEHQALQRGQRVQLPGGVALPAAGAQLDHNPVARIDLHDQFLAELRPPADEHPIDDLLREAALDDQPIMLNEAIRQLQAGPGDVQARFNEFQRLQHLYELVQLQLRERRLNNRAMLNPVALPQPPDGGRRMAAQLAAMQRRQDGGRRMAAQLAAAQMAAAQRRQERQR